MANEVMLVVNPDTTAQWEIALREGEMVLGRDPGLPFAIQHGSVSSRHALFRVEGGHVWMKDLGSTNGSFVEGAKVDEVELLPDQKIQLGEVVMRLVVRGADAVVVPRAMSLRVAVPKVAVVTGAEAGGAPDEGAGLAAVPSGVVQCRYHPKSAAGYFCRKCDKSFCGLCVTARGAAHHCRACGEACVELEGPGYLEPEEEKTFYQRLPEVFAYPFRGNGVWLILVGGLLFGLVQFLAQFSWYVTVAYVGFLVLYCQQIIQTSAQGMAKGPEWPDISGGFLSTLLPAFFQYVVILLICLGPGLGLMVYGVKQAASSLDEEKWRAAMAKVEQTNRVAGAGSNVASGGLSGGVGEGSGSSASVDEEREVEDLGIDVGKAAQGAGWVLVGGVLVGLGTLYMPMAMLSVAMFDSVAGVSPIVVVPSIFRVFLPYLIIVVLVGLCLGVWMGLGGLLNELVGIPGVDGLIAGIPGLYLLTVAMYSLGMMYHTNREKLGWF